MKPSRLKVSGSSLLQGWRLPVGQKIACLEVPTCHQYSAHSLELTVFSQLETVVNDRFLFGKEDKLGKKKAIE